MVAFAARDLPFWRTQVPRLLPPLDRLLSSIGTRSVADGQRGEEGEGYKGGGGRREKRKSRGHLPRLEGEEATWKQDFFGGWRAVFS